AASSVCSLPPCGGGLGRGWCGDMMMAPPEKHRTTPTPNPSPKGGGEHTEYAAALSIEHKDVLQITNVLRLQQSLCISTDFPPPRAVPASRTQNEPRRLKRIKALHWQTTARGSFDLQRLSGALANPIRHLLRVASADRPIVGTKRTLAYVLALAL